MRVSLITSNVGSLFENDHRLHSLWIDAIAADIQHQNADIVVLHTQETGGKHFEHCWNQVEPLFRKFVEHFPEYQTQKIYVDLDWQKFDQFTALGQVILIKRSLNITQFNFDEKNFFPIKEGLEIVTNALNDHPCVINTKFPKTFRNGRWGRKGYLHTKFKINGRLFDFVNVHLFHDESNIALVHENPTLYSEYRARALNYVIEQVKEGENGYVPHVFIFGDFNFRLHLPTFLEKITLQSVRHNLEEEAGLPHHASISNGLEATTLAPPDPIRRSLSAIEFRDEGRAHEVDNGCILRIEKKKFEYFQHKQLLHSWKDYRADDKEMEAFRDILNEFPVDFPPTYPWSEDPETHESLMTTRAPAWCDRVLMNKSAFEVAFVGSPSYTAIGPNVCMGDHKFHVLAHQVQTGETSFVQNYIALSKDRFTSSIYIIFLPQKVW